MNDEPGSPSGDERRKLPTWQEEIRRLEEQFARHYAVDEELHTRNEKVLDSLSERFHGLEKKLDNLTDIASAWQNMKGAGVVLHWVGKTVKWMAGLIVIMVAAWAAIKHGK